MVAESEAFDYLDAPILRLGRRRGADPLQPGPGEGRGAAGPRHRGRRPPPGAPRGLTCRSKSSCPRSTWTWRPGSCRSGMSPKASWSPRARRSSTSRPTRRRWRSRAPPPAGCTTSWSRPGRPSGVGAPVAWIYAEGEAVEAAPIRQPRRARGRPQRRSRDRRPPSAPRGPRAGRRARAPRRWRGGWRATPGWRWFPSPGPGRAAASSAPTSKRPCARAGRPGRGARPGPSRPRPSRARPAEPGRRKRAISTSRPARAAARRS